MQPSLDEDEEEEVELERRHISTSLPWLVNHKVPLIIPIVNSALNETIIPNWTLYGNEGDLKLATEIIKS